MYGEADGTSGVCDKAGSDPTAVKKPESTSWPACLVIKISTGNSDSDVMVEILRWLLRNAPLTLNIVPQCFILPGPQKTCLAEAGIVISVILCVCARTTCVSVPAQPEEGLGSFGGRLGASVTARVSHTQAYLFGPLQGVCGVSILLHHLGAMRNSVLNFLHG